MQNRAMNKILADSDAPIIEREFLEKVEDSLKKKEPIKISRKQRRKNKAFRTRFMRKIAKKVKAVKSTRQQGNNDAVPIKAEV